MTRVKLRILQSSPRQSGFITFVDLITDDQIDSIPFSWKSALFGRYDVLHVHWPEMFVRDKSFPRRIVKRAMYVILMVRLRIEKVPVVRTLHNLRPHEAGSKFEAFLIGWLERSTNAYVSLNPFSKVPTSAPNRLIRHAAYDEVFARFPHTPQVPGRVLYFGLVRPYKGVESLLTAFSSVRLAATLRVVGRPSDDLKSVLDVAQVADPRITVNARFVSDAELVGEITSAELVVLPYTKMHNSGALLAALSLNRHVLVPDTEVNRWIASEVGEEWFSFFSSRLTSSDIENAIVSATKQAQPPDLTNRSVEVARAAYRDVFARAIRERERRESDG